MQVAKKPVDNSFGMLAGETLLKVLKQYHYNDDYLVYPFLNVNGKCIPINKRSETSRKTLISLDGELFILKEIPWYCSNEKFVEYELGLQLLMHDNGLPIPEIITTNNGKTYSVIESGDSTRYVFLQRYVYGASWDESDDKVMAVARKLGDMHSFSEPRKEEIIARYNPPQYDVFDISLQMLDILSQEALEKEAQISSHNMNLLHHFIAENSNRIKMLKAAALHKGYNDLLMPIHGDYNPWNIIFSKENSEVIGIVDFDNSIVDNPVHDVVEGLLDFCFFSFKPQATRFRGIPVQLNKTRVRMFLDHYSSSTNGRWSSHFQAYFLEVVEAIAVELICLGIIRGDYSFADIHDLQKAIETVKVDMEDAAVGLR